MADIAPQHLLLSQLLMFMLLGFVVVVLVNDSATTVMTELRRRHRRAFQVAAQIFHATPGPAGLFGEVHLPVPLVLRLQVALPLLLIADVAMARQGCRVNALIAGTQQTDDGTAPDGFNLLFFEKQIAPNAMFDIETATGSGVMKLFNRCGWLAEPEGDASLPHLFTLIARQGEPGRDV